MALLSDQDKKRITEAVAQAEAKTSGEIVIAVLARSGDYAARRAFAALSASLFLVFLVHFLWPALDAWWTLFAILPLSLGLYALLGISALHRRLIPHVDAEVATRKKAFELFASEGVYRTRAATGVLILLSELEHRVVILGDTGIDALVKQEGWARYVEALVQALKQGKPVEGLVQVLGDIGDLLAQHFPRDKDDINELPDDVVEN